MEIVKDLPKYALEFEKTIIREINRHKNCLLVLAKGLGICKVVTLFLN